MTTLFSTKTASGLNLVIERHGAVLAIFLGLPGHGAISAFECADDELAISTRAGQPVLHANRMCVFLDDACAQRVAAHMGIARA